MPAEVGPTLRFFNSFIPHAAAANFFHLLANLEDLRLHENWHSLNTAVFRCPEMIARCRAEPLELMWERTRTYEKEESGSRTSSTDPDSSSRMNSRKCAVFFSKKRNRVKAFLSQSFFSLYEKFVETMRNDSYGPQLRRRKESGSSGVSDSNSELGSSQRSSSIRKHQEPGSRAGCSGSEPIRVSWKRKQGHALKTLTFHSMCSAQFTAWKTAYSRKSFKKMQHRNLHLWCANCLRGLQTPLSLFCSRHASLRKSGVAHGRHSLAASRTGRVALLGAALTGCGAGTWRPLHHSGPHARVIHQKSSVGQRKANSIINCIIDQRRVSAKSPQIPPQLDSPIIFFQGAVESQGQESARQVPDGRKEEFTSRCVRRLLLELPKGPVEQPCQDPHVHHEHRSSGSGSARSQRKHGE